MTILGKILNLFRQFLRVQLVFGKILNLLGQKHFAVGQIFNLVNGQILSNLSSILVTLYLE